MANRNAIVDGIKGVSAPSAKIMAKNGKAPPPKISVTFQSGKSGYLDMSKSRSPVWAEVLDSLSRENKPAYAELDPSTSEITELFIPIEVKVGEIGSPDKNGDVEVELVISHARHVVRKGNPEFHELLKVLQDAHQKDLPVIVSENDQHEIVDVRIKSEFCEGGS